MTAAGRYFVLAHRRGPAWEPDTAFMEQPGIEEHIAFMRSLAAREVLVIGGPYLEAQDDEAVGMAIIRIADPKTAGAVALEDGAVRKGLLPVDVREWSPRMGSALG